MGQRIAACSDFSDFCTKLELLDLDAHFDEQLGYLVDYEGKLLVDFVGRFETLDRDYAKICARLGLPATKLPHYRKSAHRDYTHYYDERARDIIAARYRNDIAAFGYEFR